MALDTIQVSKQKNGFWYKATIKKIVLGVGILCHDHFYRGRGGGKRLEKYAYKEVPGTGDFTSL